MLVCVRVYSHLHKEMFIVLKSHFGIPSSASLMLNEMIEQTHGITNDRPNSKFKRSQTTSNNETLGYKSSEYCVSILVRCWLWYCDAVCMQSQNKKKKRKYPFLKVNNTKIKWRKNKRKQNLFRIFVFTHTYTNKWGHILMNAVILTAFGTLLKCTGLKQNWKRKSKEK